MRITLPSMTFEVEDLKTSLKRPPAKIRRDLELAIKERLDDLCFLSICWSHEIEAKLVSDKPSEKSEETGVDKRHE